MYVLLILVLFLNLVEGDDKIECDIRVTCSDNDTIYWSTLKTEFDSIRNLPNLNSQYAENLRQEYKFCSDESYGYLLANESLQWSIACVWTDQIKGRCLPAPATDYPYDYVPRDEWRILLTNVRKAAGCPEVAITDATKVEELHVCRERCADLGFTTGYWILFDAAIFSMLIALALEEIDN